MSEYMSDRMPECMPDKMPGRFQARMPEYVSDRMPGEDEMNHAGSCFTKSTVQKQKVEEALLRCVLAYFRRYINTV